MNKVRAHVLQDGHVDPVAGPRCMIKPTEGQHQGLYLVAHTAEVLKEGQAVVYDYTTRRAVLAEIPSPQTNMVGDVDQLAAAFQDGFTNGNAEWESTPEHHKEMFREGVRTLIRHSVVSEKKAVSLPAEKPDAPVENRPEWIWYCESTSGVPVVTFGRWPKHPQQSRYKLAEIQPTEHDHPTPVTQEQARNEIARRQEAGRDPRVALAAPANVASLTGEQLQQIAYPSPETREVGK